MRHLQTADCRLADYISCYLYEYILYIPIPLSIPIPIPIPIYLYVYLYEALVWLTEVLVWLTQAPVCKSAVCKCRTPKGKGTLGIKFGHSENCSTANFWFGGKVLRVHFPTFTYKRNFLGNFFLNFPEIPYSGNENWKRASRKSFKPPSQFSQGSSDQWGELKRLTPAPRTYPLTPAPRTTLWATPRTTLRTTPTDYPKK